MKLAVLALLAVLCAAQTPDTVVLVQMFGRHGSKVPDVIDPLLLDLWTPDIGLPGQFTAQGAFEMETLGRFIKDRYPVLPLEFDQNQIYARASNFNPRPMMAGEAMMQGMYPDAPVPIYITDWTDDELLRAGNTCPSYNIEFGRIVQQLNDQYPQQFAEMMERMYEVTGWTPETATPVNLMAWAGDSVMESTNHGFGARVNPYLVEMFETIINLYGNNEWQQFRMQGADDRRGTLGQHMWETVRGNIESRIAGSSPVVGFFYPGHSSTMNQLWDALEFGGRGSRIGDTLLIELHLIGGEYFVQAHLATPEELGPVPVFTSRVHPLHCPTAQDLCPLTDFLDAMNARNREMPADEGCCFKGRSFDELGCSDYLNPLVLNIPPCRLWRDKCPHNACDVGQVVDAATLLCVPVA